jgi:hypothetical protein
LIYPDQRVVVAVIVNTGAIPDRDPFLRGIAGGFLP